MENENNTNTTSKANGWLVSLLTGWGVPGSIARIIAAAVIAALTTWYAATSTGCTATYARNANGDMSYSGSVILPEVNPETK